MVDTIFDPEDRVVNNTLKSLSSKSNHFSRGGNYNKNKQYWISGGDRSYEENKAE